MFDRQNTQQRSGEGGGEEPNSWALMHLQSPGKLVRSGWQGAVQCCPWGTPPNCCWLPDPPPDPCSFPRCPLLRCWSCHEMSPQWTLVMSCPACQSSSLHCSGCTAAAPSTSRFFCTEERWAVSQWDSVQGRKIKLRDNNWTFNADILFVVLISFFLVQVWLRVDGKN